MNEAEEPTKASRIARILDRRNRLLRAWRLEGGVTAEITALDIEHANGVTGRVVVRQRLGAELAAARRVAVEFEVLRLLQSARLPAPAPLYLDTSCAVLAAPYLVMEFLDGEKSAPAEPASFVRQLAATLASIHAVDAETFDLTFLPDQEKRYFELLERPPIAAELPEEIGARRTLRARAPFPRRNSSVLLHGDYWPGNTLWRDGRLVAVIDWEDAAFGDPLADVANARVELLLAHGTDAMASFTHEYGTSTAGVDFAHLPLWDLWAGLRIVPHIGDWGLDDQTQRTMRDRHRSFVAETLARLDRR